MVVARWFSDTRNGPPLHVARLPPISTLICSLHVALLFTPVPLRTPGSSLPNILGPDRLPYAAAAPSTFSGYTMWVLKTDLALLQYYESPENVPGGYAILSHHWNGTEDSFQDMMKLRDQYNSDETHKPIDHVQEKTRRSCELALSQGFNYLWIDSCSVDRSHNSERGNDIKSQFRYFSLAHVCYVYLHDVPANGGNPNLAHSPFRKARWHVNPWTLQELVAPDTVIFFSREWTVLGTKQSLASPLLEEITGVPAAVLTFEKSLASYSIAARMSWAAPRIPTERQDGQAYSLLGIMGVNMDVPYGEGQKAFQRLQEEITKQLADTSVFVWGSKPPLRYSEVVELVNRLQPVPAPHVRHSDESSLFASTPSAFKSGFAQARSMPHLFIGNTTYALDTSKLMTFTIKDDDVFARLPVIDLRDQRVLIAFISCSLDTKPLGLVLHKCPNTTDGVPIYDVGLDDPNGSGTYRLVTLENVSSASQGTGTDPGQRMLVWRTIRIRGRHTHDPSQDVQRIPLNRHFSSFYFKRDLFERFGGRYMSRATAEGQQQASLAGAPLETDTFPATFLLFADAPTSKVRPFLVHFGRCTKGSSADNGAHWANVKPCGNHLGTVEGVTVEPSNLDQTHQCPSDHMLGWQNQQKTFPIVFSPLTYGIRLSFLQVSGAAGPVLIPEIAIVYIR